MANKQSEWARHPETTRSDYRKRFRALARINAMGQTGIDQEVTTDGKTSPAQVLTASEVQHYLQMLEEHIQALVDEIAELDSYVAMFKELLVKIKKSTQKEQRAKIKKNNAEKKAAIEAERRDAIATIGALNNRLDELK